MFLLCIFCVIVVLLEIQVAITSVGEFKKYIY